MAEEIVVAGADGMLGRAFVELLEADRRPFEAAVHPAFDLTDRKSLARAVPEGVRLVVNCAAYTDVDGAEADEDTATMVNGRGVGALAERCRDVGATLLHFSTDYVFDGQASSPYRVDDPISPVNAYGRSKAEGERRLREAGGDHLLVRTSWLYAAWGKNFVLTMARLAKERPELRVVDDQRGRPTHAVHLARTSLRLFDAGERGTFHVCDGGECTWFELAREVAARVAPDCHVEPCTSAEFPRPAPRPAYSVLDLSQTEAALGPMPLWRDQLFL